MNKLLPVMAVALTLAGVVPSMAHARLTKSDPAAGATVAAPKTVTIEYSEGVVPRFSGIAIRDSANKPVKTGKPASGGTAKSLTVSIEQPLAPGAYAVTWHAVSVDSHRTQGSFTFKVAP